MGIFDRMGRVISSNLNSLLDKADDPKKSLALTIDEMGSSLAAAKKEIVEALGTQKRLSRKVDELDADVAKCPFVVAGAEGSQNLPTVLFDRDMAA